jgi:hypothetical protein
MTKLTPVECGIQNEPDCSVDTKLKFPEKVVTEKINKKD